MGAKIDLTGKTFTRLKVLEEYGRDNFGQVLWKCECSCKNENKNIIIVRGRDLRSGGTKSCGCLDVEMATMRIKNRTINHSNIESIKSKKLSKANTSGVRGVCPTKRGTWRAVIGYKGQQIFLGEYSDIRDAIKARKEGEEKYFKPVIEEIENIKNSEKRK